MTCLLDTDTVIFAIRARPAAVRTQLGAMSPDDVVVSAITVAELWYGAAKDAEPARRRAVFEAFLEPYEVIPFDRAAAEHHGRLRHDLRHEPIGERDLLIASIAVARGLSVVTGNQREFARVPGLETVDWSG